MAGRIAERSYMLNGLLVAVTGILAAAVSNPGFVPVPPALVVNQALSLAAGALGGLAAWALARRQAA